MKYYVIGIYSLDDFSIMIFKLNIKYVKNIISNMKVLICNENVNLYKIMLNFIANYFVFL